MESSYEWQREPLPDFLQSPGLQNFIKEVYKAKGEGSFSQNEVTGTFELYLGNAIYHYAISDGPIRDRYGNLAFYDGTLPKIAAPEESNDEEIFRKYQDLILGPRSISWFTNGIANQVPDSKFDNLTAFLTLDTQGDDQPKPFLDEFVWYGLKGFEGRFRNVPPHNNPLDGYSREHLRADLIAGSMSHHIATTILQNPFFFLDDIQNLAEIVSGPQNPVDKLYRDLLQCK